MQDLGLGGARSINAFVKEKLDTFRRMDVSFASLFELMFREKENIMYERSAGYRIETTTYGQAYDGALRLAGAVKTALSGAEPGEVVGLYMENGLLWIESFWAILAAGYRPLLMNRRLPKPVLEKALGAVGAAAVISDGETFVCPTVLAESLDLGEPLTLSAVFGDELLIMSSGTTDKLKICAYSAQELYYQILESYEIIRDCAPIKKHYHGKLKLLTFLPFYHIFGLVAVYIWFAFFSRTFVHLADMAPDTIVNTVRRHEVTHIFAVPLFWEKVYEQAQAAIARQDAATRARLQKGLRLAGRIGDIPVIGPAFIRRAFRPVREKIFGESVCFLITGGSGIPTPVLTFFNQIGYRLSNGYGMTEIGITSVELSGKQKQLCAGFVGKPFAYVEYKIDDGELLVRGKATARRILEDGKPVDIGEWYHTGDLAECVKGHYRILGRRDDVIVAPNGENLNPELLESYFLGEDVGAVALIREATPEGERPVLLVSVRRTLPPPRFTAVDTRLRETVASLGLSALLGRIVYTADPLIRTDEFKCNRARLSRDFAAGKLTVLPPEQFDRADEAGDDPVTGQVRFAFAAALGKSPEEIRSDADFFLDEGGTSLDYFAMIAALQEEFAMPFPAEGEAAYRTVAQIASYISDGEQHVD